MFPIWEQLLPHWCHWDVPAPGQSRAGTQGAEGSKTCSVPGSVLLLRVPLNPACRGNCSSFLSLPAIKRNVWWWISVCYFDGAWSIFWTWKGRRKRERWSYLWKMLFYSWSLCLCFCFLKFLFSWVSLCFICLFILYANYFHALVNLWSKYCRALNVKLNLTSFEKLLEGDCGHKFAFPHPPFFAYL